MTSFVLGFYVGVNFLAAIIVARYLAYQRRIKDLERRYKCQQQ